MNEMVKIETGEARPLEPQIDPRLAARDRAAYEAFFFIPKGLARFINVVGGLSLVGATVALVVAAVLYA